MAPIVDPWGGYNQGMANLSNTLSDLSNAKRQREIDAVNLRRLALEEKSQGSLLAEREAKLADLEAQRGALQQVYGAATPQEAYAAQIKAEIQAKRTGEFFKQMKELKDSGASPQFRTEYAKRQISKIPEYAELANSISYMDDEKIKVVKDIGPNQVPDPSDPTKFLPAGKYELEGKATGDPKMPFKFTTAVPFVDKEAMMDKRFEQQNELQGKRQQAADARLDKQLSAADARQSRALAAVAARREDNNPVVQSQFVDPESGKPLVFDKKTGTYRISTVEGGVTPKPAAFTPESAAKAQLIEQGLSYITSIREGLIGADGKIDRMNVANIAARTPFTKGRELSTLILDTVEAKLRAESGAAVPDTEVKRIAKRYIPQIADSDSTIKLKIDNMEKFLKGTSEKINKGRNKTPGKKPLSAY